MRLSPWQKLKKITLGIFIISFFGANWALDYNAKNTPIWDDPYIPFDGSVKISQSSYVTWVAVMDIDAVCKNEMKKRVNNSFAQNVNACSFWDKTTSGSTCTIYTKINPTMHTLGHEMRHCFQGDWHSQ